MCCEIPSHDAVWDANGIVTAGFGMIHYIQQQCNQMEHNFPLLV